MAIPAKDQSGGDVRQFQLSGGAAADVSGGDLPAQATLRHLTPVTVVQDLPIPNGIVAGSDEGRAMVQIVHDIAPKRSSFSPVLLSAKRALPPTSSGCAMRQTIATS